jgi:CDP-glycerol glycerophosphotransferase (TagB/SpsB family)
MDSNNKINIDFVTLRDNVLNISGYLRCANAKKGVSVECNGSNVNVDSFDYPTRQGDDIYNFDFKVPADKNLKITINSKDDIDYPIRFREFCNLSHFSKYYVKDNRIVYFNGSFNVVDYSYSSMLKLEVKELIDIIKNRPGFYAQAMLFRLMFLVAYPFMKNKDIWLVMDRKTMADDNAEHLFKYIKDKKDGIKKFFVLHNASPDFSRINQLFKGQILDCDSFKHKLYYIFTKKLISSQGSEFDLNPFLNTNHQLTAGICNLDFYFLQHGVIKDNMSSWLRKYDRNPKLIVTSTQGEYESMFDEGYFYDEDVIQLLGLPRYDNLTNENVKKQIVIMPTWRNYITNEKALLDSEYFKRFNSLINNEKLIEYAQNNGYEIVFKPHPELTQYLDLFDKSDYVQFDRDKKYQDIFNESSLLITDYSSIFFDFSYLKKPLIYYQYVNDYHYDTLNGYFKYETMGFGPIMDNEEDLICKIIFYIDNGCVMEEIYKKRIENIFKYNDHNNSKRCYEWILKH